MPDSPNSPEPEEPEKEPTEPEEEATRQGQEPIDYGAGEEKPIEQQEPGEPEPLDTRF